MNYYVLGLLLVSVACAHADGDALYQQGAAMFKANPVQALELFEQAADEGNVSAMVGAGHCFETGTGTKIDYAKALAFYEQAAQWNSLNGSEGLARIYASCPDPEFHDGEKAVKFASAVVQKKQRDTGALGLLATAYARNCEFQKAIDAATKASRNAGDIETAQKMTTRVDCLKAGEPEPAVATEGWYLRAAEKNSTWAMVEMASRYANRDGRLYDAANAIQMYRKAIKAGRTDLLYPLGNVYFYADNEEVDLDKARECYEQAVEAKCYPRGEKVPCEVQFSSYLGGSAESCFELANKYRTGWTHNRKEESGDYLPDGTPIYTTEPQWMPAKPEAARFLFLIAHKKGHPQAKRFVTNKPATKRSAPTPAPAKKTASGLPIPTY